MKQTKLISLLLVLCMVAALLVPGTVAMEAKAADGDDTEGLVVNKTATAKGDGIYTITLEAYATGASTTISTSKDKPTDIILVLDQSGSMGEERMSTYSFEAYSTSGYWRKTNDDFYDLRHNDGGLANLYYKLSEDSYASVSVVREQKISYNPIASDTSNSSYYYYRNNLYAFVDGEYRKVTVARSGTGYRRQYSYSIEGVDEPFYSTQDSAAPDFDGIQMYTATVDSDQNVYTYYYNDESGTQQKLGPYTGADSAPSDVTFYERTSRDNGPYRIDALKSAVATFIDQVNTKAKGPDGQYGTEDDIDHRIAVVGFATGSYSENSYYPAYENTELFIGSDQYNYNGNGINAQYANAFQAMNTQQGYQNVVASKNALNANGATCIDLGMQMASNIFNANPIDNEERNRVVIVFSDGQPSQWADFSATIGQNAINISNAIKNTHGATVYTVGVFDGADATSEGTSSGNSEADHGNWVMQGISNNNGTPRSPSYYLSAADAGTLSSIFQQIAGSIESGGTTVKLDGNSVIRDVVSPYFKLPDGATPENISLSLVPCTGVNQSGELTWGGSEQAEGVSATVDGRNISVTGFDFSGNWCGPRTVDGETKYSGKKLVISFVVETEPGFLGGNNVPTNANAGVYENPDKTEPLKKFPVPEVNVPIKDITVTAGDKNVYLLGDLTKEQLTSGATVEAGENIEITLDPTVKNYGLQPWQYAFVEIKTSLTDSENNPLNNGFTDLKKDTDYHLTVTVSPKEEAKETSDGTPAGEKTNQDTAKVNVFKPEITWQDTCIDAGKTPVYKSDESVDQNFVSLNWKHVETISTDKGVTMIGSKPILTYTYDPEAKPLTEETPVKVTVKIDDQDVTTDSVFVHDDECTFDNCKWETEYKGKGYHFVVHLNTFDLTIEKSGCNERLDPNQSFVFHVTGPNDFSMEVVIKGDGSTTIKNLPAGSYTVKEDTNWSWRYNPSRNGLTGNPENPEVTFSNTRNNDYWLDGNAYRENPFEGIPATN